MLCTHGIRYELKCPACTEAALQKNKSLPCRPDSTATKAEREAFWSNAYKETIVKNEY